MVTYKTLDFIGARGHAHHKKAVVPPFNDKRVNQLWSGTEPQTHSTFVLTVLKAFCAKVLPLKRGIVGTTEEMKTQCEEGFSPVISALQGRHR